MASPPQTPPRGSTARNLVMASSPEHGSAPSTPRNAYQAKKKKFSIKGMLTGDSRKDRKARQQKQQQQSSNSARRVPSTATPTSPALNASRSIDTEAETVYQVDVDDRTISVMSSESKPTTATDKTAEGFLAGGKKSYMLKVVLLLMDPNTRRFELLQLEFDSDKALVSDVLTQIPVAVTEEVLKKQTYVGICGSSGDQMESGVLLSEFCKGNDVLVAVSSGVAASECARLAKPILNDDKVVKMLKASGIDPSPWHNSNATSKNYSEPEPGLIAEPTPPTKSRALPDDMSKAAPSTESGSGGGAFGLVFIVLIGVFLQMYHGLISQPIVRGQVLSPGGWISKCGIMSLLPSCNNTYLVMDDEGGLSFFNGEGDLEWKMEGKVCDSDDCISGLELRDDNRIYIGGKQISWVNVKKGAEPISPWPFEEQPNIKIIHGRK